MICILGLGFSFLLNEKDKIYWNLISFRQKEGSWKDKIFKECSVGATGSVAFC